MMEQYFEFLYIRDIIVPVALAIVVLSVIGIVSFYDLLCKWNEKRRKWKEEKEENDKF